MVIFLTFHLNFMKLAYKLDWLIFGKQVLSEMFKFVINGGDMLCYNLQGEIDSLYLLPRCL